MFDSESRKTTTNQKSSGGRRDCSRSLLGTCENNITEQDFFLEKDLSSSSYQSREVCTGSEAAAPVVMQNLLPEPSPQHC
jgi:hypothetical protein